MIGNIRIGALPLNTPDNENTTHYFHIHRLIAGDGSAPREQVVLVVQNEKIQAIEDVQSVSRDLTFTDLGTATVIPGLIDAHTHIMAEGDARRAWSTLFFEELIATTAYRAAAHAQQALRAGFTTLRDLGCRDYVDVALRNAIRDGLVAGPRLLVSGVPLTSTGGHFDNLTQIPGVVVPGQSGLCNSPDEARQAARYQVKMGVDVLKIAIDGRRRNVYHTESITHQEMSIDEIQAVVEVAEWAGIHVAAHSDGGPVLRDAAAVGVRTIEHIQDLSAADAASLAQSGAYLVPTLTATHNTMAAGLEATGLSPRHFGFFIENWEAKKRGMAHALAEGVQIALGTDAGYRFCRHGENAKELVLLVETGMTPMQALTAATQTAAQAIGLDHLLGTLEPGKLADFVVVDGDPLTDIGLLTRPEAILDVYKEGVNLAQMGL